MRPLHTVRRASLVAVLLTAVACTQPPPSWQQLLASKVREQFPTYDVVLQPDGNPLVRRPGKSDAPVDVQDIARFCQRGPKDCNYATDTMLEKLR